MRVSASILSALLLTSAGAHAQSIAEPPASNPSALPPEAQGQVAPPPGDPALPPTSEPAAPPASEPAALPVVEESFDPALLGGTGDAQLSAEELEKLGFGGGTPSVDTNIKVFGFADATFQMAPQKPSNTWRETVAPHSTFFVGNFNLYLTKNLSENVRTMSEVRFHYSPLGSNNQDGSYQVTNATDPADFNRNFHWGGIEIQRIYLEWQLHTYLAVRAGQFLTPYGIWNVDHGSPLFIPVTRPYVIGSGLFPQRQTGLEFLGRYDLGNDNTLGYHFTLSNGMGPIAEIRDLDENKAVGARVFWEYRKLGTLRIGGSALYAKDTIATFVSGLDAAGRLAKTERIDQQSDVLSLAADLQWRYAGWHVQSEVITQQRKFTTSGRVAGTNPFTGNPIFPQDYLTWGVYGLLGYGFDVKSVNVMPYVQVQSFDQLDTTFLKTKTNGVTAGLNIRPLDAVVVKFAYVSSRFPDGHIVSDGAIHLLQSQVAWAF